MKNLKSFGCWILDILISIDKLANVLFKLPLNYLLNPEYKFGNHRDTLSEVLGRNKGTCKTCYWICRALHLLDKNHCEKSIE